MIQKTLFDFERKEEEVIAVDWAIKKPIVVYDGERIETFESLYIFSDSISSEILCEEGVPRSLFTIDKTIKLVPGAIVKEKRKELGLEKSDENDAKIIYWLYQENPDLFRNLKEREVGMELLKKKIKTYLRYQKIEVGIGNMNRSLTYEYGIFEDIDKLKYISKTCKEQEKRLEKDIEKILKAHFYKEVKKLIAIKGLSYILIGKLLAFVGDIGRFKTSSELKSYAGIAPNKGNYKEKDYNYSRNLQMILLGKKQICDEFIMKRVEPYRTIYDKYKERLEKERFDESKGHIDNMARRKIADKFLRDMWRLLKG